MIDWDKPVQWNDGTAIDDVQPYVTRALDGTVETYEVFGPTPSNWPEDCVEPKDGVVVSTQGDVEGWECEKLKVINVPVVTHPTIDWNKPIAWYDGTPAVINDKLNDDWWEAGVGDDDSAAVLVPDHIKKHIGVDMDDVMGRVVERDGTIYQEGRIPMPCIRNVENFSWSAEQDRIAKADEREAMEQNPLWGSF